MPAITDFMSILGLGDVNAAPEEFLDLDDVLATLQVMEEGVFADASRGKPATNLEFEWEDEYLTGLDVKLSVELLTGETSLTLADATAVQAGAMIRCLTAQGVDEVMQLTSVNSATGVCNVTRAYGNTTKNAGTYAVDVVFQIVGQPKGLSAYSTNDKLVTSSRRLWKNYVQLYTFIVEFPEIKKFIKSSVVSDEYQHQLTNRTKQKMQEWMYGCLFGEKASASIDHGNGSETTYTTAGLLAFLKAVVDADGNTVTPNYDHTDEVMDLGVIDNMNQEIRNDAGASNMPNVLYAPSDMISLLARKKEDKIEYKPSDKVMGSWMISYKTDLGNVIQLKVDRTLPNDTVIMGPIGKIERRIMVPWGAVPLTEGNRAWVKRMRMIGAWGYQVSHPDKLWFVHDNLKLA